MRSAHTPAAPSRLSRIASCGSSGPGPTGLRPSCSTVLPADAMPVARQSHCRRVRGPRVRGWPARSDGDPRPPVGFPLVTCVGMSAQPVHDPDPDDPVEILRVLPERFHDQFLAEYYEAAGEAARQGGRVTGPTSPPCTRHRKTSLDTVASVSVGCSGRFRWGGPVILRGAGRLPSERTPVMRDR